MGAPLVLNPNQVLTGNTFKAVNVDADDYFQPGDDICLPPDNNFATNLTNPSLPNVYTKPTGPVAIGLDEGEFGILQKLIAVGVRLEALSFAVVHDNLGLYSTDFIDGFTMAGHGKGIEGTYGTNKSFLDNVVFKGTYDSNGNFKSSDPVGFSASSSRGMYIVGTETDKIMLATQVLTKAEDASDQMANKILNTYV